MITIETYKGEGHFFNSERRELTVTMKNLAPEDIDKAIAEATAAVHSMFGYPPAVSSSPIPGTDSAMPTSLEGN